MNYRHHFHAGNFADVWKHALLLPLIAGLQRKEKGLLFLDTHAGRGSYDLASTVRGESLERKPEFPDGIGRLWDARNLSSELQDYLNRVKQFSQAREGDENAPGFYPGSPWLAQLALRPQDRLALCELHPEEFSFLADEFSGSRGVSLHPLDGYTAVRAMLPPREKRALVLIDPPFEQKNEFSNVQLALRDALRRLPGATLAVWYPLTERARADEFLGDFVATNAAPALVVEVIVAGAWSPLKMRGCGLLVVNPPWQIESVFQPMVRELAELLSQGPGSEGILRWIVPER